MSWHLETGQPCEKDKYGRINEKAFLKSLKTCNSMNYKGKWQRQWGGQPVWLSREQTMLAVCQDHLHSQDWLVCTVELKGLCHLVIKDLGKTLRSQNSYKTYKKMLLFETGSSYITQASLELTANLCLSFLQQRLQMWTTTRNSDERRLIFFLPL